MLIHHGCLSCCAWLVYSSDALLYGVLHNSWRRLIAYYDAQVKNLHFHKFPSNLEFKKLWIVAIRRDEGPNSNVSWPT